VIGYGSQGHAHALNLQDSGVDVVVGLYQGSKSWAQAEEEDLRVETVEKAVEISDLVMMLVPDQTQKLLYEESVKPHLKAGSALMFDDGRGARDQLQGRDRDRPLRGAGRALRRAHLTGEGRLRHPGRSGLPARAGLLRVPARDEADRRPDVPGWDELHALQHQRHGGVRRLRQRASHHRPPGAR